MKKQSGAKEHSKDGGHSQLRFFVGGKIVLHKRPVLGAALHHPKGKNDVQGIHKNKGHCQLDHNLLIFGEAET